MYKTFFRVFILRMDTERAHQFAIRSYQYLWPLVLGARWLRAMPPPDDSLRRDVLGLRFSSPLGVAAGMDKDAQAVRGLAFSGFSHVEVGTITPRAQPGNEKPRAWRELELNAIRNRMGFNNDGAGAAAARLARLRRSQSGKKLIVGANIGKNKLTDPASAAEDYEYCSRLLAPHVDYLVVNVSSPNTPGLRALQEIGSLERILERSRAGADAGCPERRIPLLVKIAPDLADADVLAIARLVRGLEIEGVVATNTTVDHKLGEGGLSGPPVRERALEVVSLLRRELGESTCIVGVGGITSDEDVRKMLEAGADLVQAYTALVYNGPFWPSRVNRSLAKTAKRRENPGTQREFRAVLAQ